jgi:hypothetical protein
MLCPMVWNVLMQTSCCSLPPCEPPLVPEPEPELEVAKQGPSARGAEVVAMASSSARSQPTEPHSAVAAATAAETPAHRVGAEIFVQVD